jgi:hypothetical protein
LIVELDEHEINCVYLNYYLANKFHHDTDKAYRILAALVAMKIEEILSKKEEAYGD